MSIQVSIQATDAVRAAHGVRLVNYAATRAAVRATCAIVGVSEAAVSITWMSDDEIASLNEEYLTHDGPTDVISFHLYEEHEEPVGDIYIGYDEALRQAISFTTTLEDELVRLAVHGTLHILGFDHPYGDERTDSDMWHLQEAIVAEVLA